MEKLLTAPELSEILGVKLSTVYSWSHKKAIPRVQGLRLLRFKEAEVLAWLSKPSTPVAMPVAMPKARKTRTGKSAYINKILEQAKKEVLS